MATVTGLTAARMLAIEAASVVGGTIDGSGHLILTKHDSSTIDAGYMLASLPDASDTVKGKVELATDAETITGTDTVRAITPASLTAAIAAALTTLAMTGEIRIWGGVSPPTNWLSCDGSSVSRTTYANLFSVVAPSMGTTTMTIASPCVVTSTAHGLIAGDKVFFTTTGALPTGLSANTVYYVLSAGLATDTFRVSATDGGSAINTSGSQSGTHTLRRAPYGIADSTHFNLPNLKGSVPAGRDSSQTEFANIGKTGGEKTHTLTSSEMPSHTHVQNSHVHAQHDSTYQNVTSSSYLTPAGSGSIFMGVNNYNGTAKQNTDSTTPTNQNTGGDGAHNNLQPYVSMLYIIKT